MICNVVGVNLLCGVALLSTPYAVKEGGWLGLSIMFIFCVLCFYTGLLLRDCLDTHPRLQTYPDIGEAAFGIPGRLLVSVSLFIFIFFVEKKINPLNDYYLTLCNSFAADSFVCGVVCKYL